MFSDAPWGYKEAADKGKKAAAEGMKSWYALVLRCSRRQLESVREETSKLPKAKCQAGRGKKHPQIKDAGKEASEGNGPGIKSIAISGPVDKGQGHCA